MQEYYPQNPQIFEPQVFQQIESQTQNIIEHHMSQQSFEPQVSYQTFEPQIQ